MTLDGFPRRYRRLLVTFTPAWRRLYGEMTLSTLLEMHAAKGRGRPTLEDHFSFAVAGLKSRLLRPAPSRSDSTLDLADPAGPPPRMSPLDGGFLITAALGADAPTKAFPPPVAIPSIDELTRRRYTVGWRLLAEALVLVGAIVLLTWGPADILLVTTGVLLIALTATLFDLALSIRLGQRILAEP